LQVRVLGSIEGTRDGQAIRLAGRGQQAVLRAPEPSPAGDARPLQRASAGTRG
jgi:hypothetical protein